MRSRLFLLVVIPTVTAVAAGGIFIASSVQSAFVYQRVQTLANLSGKTTGLVQALQTERQDTVRFIVLGSTNNGRGAPRSNGRAAARRAAQPRLRDHHRLGQPGQALAGGIDGSYSTLAQQDTQRGGHRDRQPARHPRRGDRHPASRR